ncbi:MULTISPECIES: serpin family protein [unclassified Actinotalea]|uniref:serpin family protein n=1 Tax=unclassified Actinotalea TaxID=2638618 RepID=UPI0015F49407|nr:MULTISPECIES: serpin family protein [unclassified Actinotalea]
MPATTASLVSQFAADVNRAHATEHGVVSPLGLWLLLALTAPSATGAHRSDLEAALGTDARDAADRAAALLADAHPAVATAVALWTRARFVDAARHRALAATLPAAVAVGAMPTQAEADRWAAEHTGGLLTRFPLDLDDDAAVVLASALAAKVSWLEPFDDAPASDLGGEFGQRTALALRAPAGHDVALLDTDAAGPVAAHAAESATGLRVLSVMAGPDVPAAAVHDAAAQVAAALDVEAPGARRLDVFDLPTGPGAAWDVAETREEILGAHGDRHTTWTAYLAPWSAESRHDLAGAPGVRAALATLTGLLSPAAGSGDGAATQVARAEYTREGFAAAAVTAMGIRATGMPMPRLVTHRRVTVRFNRPYAVVALARATAPDPARPWDRRTVAGPAWDGVPVFSAWVARPGA